MENKRTEAKSSYHVGGMSIVFVQLVLSVLFLVLARENGMIPGKYLVPIGAGLLVFFGIAFGLQFLRGKKYIVGLVISILVDLILVGGIFSIYKADKLLVQVGGATYKTDSMVVVVRADDSAKTLEDAKDYRYGIQTSVDVENTDKMLEDVEKNVGRTVKVDVHLSHWCHS